MKATTGAFVLLLGLTACGSETPTSSGGGSGTGASSWTGTSTYIRVAPTSSDRCSMAPFALNVPVPLRLDLDRTTGQVSGTISFPGAQGGGPHVSGTIAGSSVDLQIDALACFGQACNDGVVRRICNSSYRFTGTLAHGRIQGEVAQVESVVAAQPTGDAPLPGFTAYGRWELTLVR